jgi:hypothetical protein
MFCTKCGSQMSESERFCSNCGAPAKAAAPDHPPPAPPTAYPPPAQQFADIGRPPFGAPGAYGRQNEKQPLRVPLDSKLPLVAGLCMAAALLWVIFDLLRRV